MKNMTHTGTIIGSGLFYPGGQVKLRETKTMWIQANGSKWRKRDGFAPNVEWPRQHLDISSVKPI